MPDIPPEGAEAVAERFPGLGLETGRQIARLVLDAAAPSLREPYEDLLGCISLYVPWRFVTLQLTTEQKEMWADAVEAWSAQLNAGTDETTTVDRWWRDDGRAVRPQPEEEK